MITVCARTQFVYNLTYLLGFQVYIFIFDTPMSEFAALNENIMYTIAGQPNPSAFILTSKNNLVYATGSYLIVYKCEFKIEYVGTFTADMIGNTNCSPITSISSYNNTIFISFDDQIASLSLEGQLICKVSLGSTVNKISSSNQFVFVGSNDFVVCNHDLHVVFRSRMPFPIYLLSCTEDGKFIITSGYQDHLLKVWSLKHALLRGKRIDYSFAYLKHPKPVVHVEWKNDGHILLTNCMDMTTRIYQEDENRLCLTCLIEPSKFSNNNNYISLHWLSKSVLSRMLDTSNVKHLTPTRQQDEMTFMNYNLPNPSLLQDETLHYWQQKVQLLMHEHPVLIFGISSNGNLLVWSLLNMQTTPRSIARVVNLLNVYAFNPVDKPDVDSDSSYFLSTIHTYHAAPPVVLDEEMSPYKLYFIGQNLMNGHIHVYHVDFIESFLKQHSSSTFELIANYQGHIVCNTVKYFGFIRHPDHLFPFLISYRDSDVIVWQVVDHLLIEIGKLNIDKTLPRSIKWIPNDPAFIIFAHFKCYVYHIVYINNKPSLQLFSKCYIPFDYTDYHLFINPPSSHLDNLQLLLFLANTDSIHICTLATLADVNDADFTIKSQFKHSICHINRLFTSTFYSANPTTIPLFCGIYDQLLICFTITDESNADNISILSQYPVSDGVQFVRSCPGCIAIIYEDRISFYHISMDYQMIFINSLSFALGSSNANICAVDWITNNDSQVIAVATMTHIYVCSFVNEYTIISSISINSTLNCRLTWLFNGSICIMNKQHLSILKTNNISTNSSMPYQGIVPILDYISNLSSPLPEYHPFIIHQYLLLNRADIVTVILNRLHFFIINKISIPLVYDDVVEQEQRTSTSDLTAIDEIISDLLQSLTSKQTCELIKLDDPEVQSLVQILHYFSKIHRKDRFDMIYDLLLATPASSSVTPTLATMLTGSILAWFGVFSNPAIDPTWSLNDYILNKCAFYCNFSNIEQLAKQEYIKSKNIELVMILYLGLNRNNNKINIIAMLWKHSTLPDANKMVLFLKSYIASPSALTATKNAYVLLSKQRYLMAVSFFLLGTEYESAIMVLLNHCEMDDLALILATALDNKALINTVLNHISSSGNAYIQALCLYKLNNKTACINVLNKINKDNVGHNLLNPMYAYIISNHVEPNSVNIYSSANYYKQYNQLLGLVAASNTSSATSIMANSLSGLINNVLSALSAHVELKLSNSSVDYKNRITNSINRICTILDIEQSVFNEYMTWYCMHAHLFTLYYEIVELNTCATAASIASSTSTFNEQLLLYSTRLLNQCDTGNTQSSSLYQYLSINGINLLATIIDCCDNNSAVINQITCTCITLLINVYMELKEYYKIAIILQNSLSIFALLNQQMLVELKVILQQVYTNINSNDKEEPLFPNTVSGRESKQVLDLLIYRFIMHHMLNQSQREEEQINRHTGQVLVEQQQSNQFISRLIHPIMIKCLELENESSKNKIYDFGNYYNNLQYSSMQDVWELCYTWASQQGLIKNLTNKQSLQPNTNIVIENAIIEENVHDLVKLQTVIFASGINVVNDNELVICTSKGIYEIDVNYAWCCYMDVDTDQCSVSSKTNDGIPKNQLEESLTQISSQAELEEYHPTNTPPMSAPMSGGHSPNVGSPTGTLPRNASFLNAFHRKKTDSQSISESFINEVVKLNRPIVCKELAINPKYKIYACEQQNTPNTSNSWSMTNTNTSSIGVYQFNTSKVIIEFVLRNPQVKINFDPFGEKFGCWSVDGHLLLYDLVHGKTPVMENQLNYRVGNDFCFLNSGTLLAVSGKQNGGKIGIYDSLLPQNRAEVETYSISEHCTYRIGYHNNQLISVGKKGEITVIDIRQHKIIDTFHAHNSSINTMLINEDLDSFMTGSVEGSLKQFSLDSHDCIRNYKKLHSTKFMGALEKSGISSICQSHLNVYTTGYDGHIKFIRKGALKVQLPEDGVS
eukprot:NODE_25_length_35605_cov_0.353461.p1 type:complete len:1954 gc:universal NODE_25_length_35605_cov_0.353461:17242-11381(-)